MNSKYNFDDFVKIIEGLRAPDGCPWDRQQTHESLKPCMVNETAEALAAIDVWRETGDSGNLCEELGDMLLQVVLQSQIASEEGLFTIGDVVQSISEKMLRRHPHVFGNERGNLLDWEAIKREEKKNVPPIVEKAKNEALRKAQSDMVKQLSCLLKEDRRRKIFEIS